MVERVQDSTPPAQIGALPRIVFVLGKGGVGRSTVAAALALRAARRGERALILQWAIADSIGPWFGVAPAGAQPVELAPRISTANFALDYALRAYFVEHLHAGLLYRRVIRARPVARLLAVAPGLAEMFFLGELWWLVTLAAREAQLDFDRIIVDAPATGHGASLLEVPKTLAHMGAGGVLALETRRVLELMTDPTRIGAVVVTLPEPLVVDETRELIARLAHRPVASIVNRSALPYVGGPPVEGALAAIDAELRARAVIERTLGATASLPELPGRAPLDVVRACAEVL